MTDIFHEVEEDLRRDRLNKVWARYGTVFLTIAVLAIAATGAFVWWQGRQQASRDGAAEAFSTADSLAAAGDLEGALKAYTEIAAPGGDGYPTLALFRQASLLTARNDVQGALAIYDKIATGTVDDRLKALAQIRAAFLVSDTEAPDVLTNRVTPFTGDENPWRFQARELMAYAEFRARNESASADAYAKIAADEAAPATMRARAGQMVAFLRGGAVLPPEATEPVAPPVDVPAAPPAEEPKTEAPAETPAETAPPSPTP